MNMTKMATALPTSPELGEGFTKDRLAQTMRILPLVLLAALVLSPAMAQTMTVTSEHQVRIGFGDLPSTNEPETAGVWNVEHRVTIPEGENRTITLPAGHQLGVTHVDDEAEFEIAIVNRTLQLFCHEADPNNEAGICLIVVPHFIGGSVDAFGMALRVLSDNTVIVYASNGLEVVSGSDNLVGDDFYFPETTQLIHQYQVDNGRFWMTVQPESFTVEVPEPASFHAWQGLVLGLLIGAGVWYLLVRQGMVQKRHRKQVAGTAAHKTAAAKENKATLEWRRRAMLAAMKELELARADQNIDLEAYDLLKADFKKQTVTVMRALEEMGE